MDSKQTKDIINNMSEEELNDFIFFALKEMTKKYENLKKQIQDKIDKLNKELEYPTTANEARIQIRLLEELLKEESEV